MDPETAGPEGFAPGLLVGVPMADPGFDRCASERVDPDLVPRLLARNTTRVLEVAATRAPVDPGSGGLRWRPPEPGDEARLVAYLGRGDGMELLAVLGGNEHETDPGWQSLRSLGEALGPLDAAAVATAAGLDNWHATHRHCPRCGAETVATKSGWTRTCPTDGSEHFPRTDPAVIVAVLDADDRLLLARHPAWPPRRMSVLAGFVEPGESLAAAVRREVHEEVGLTLLEVRYLGDQPWPFPSSLMVGFEARAADVILTLDGEEIAEARWFRREEYRDAVARGELIAGTGLSISRRLVDRWLHSGPSS